MQVNKRGDRFLVKTSQARETTYRNTAAFITTASSDTIVLRESKRRCSFVGIAYYSYSCHLSDHESNRTTSGQNPRGINILCLLLFRRSQPLCDQRFPHIRAEEHNYIPPPPGTDKSKHCHRIMPAVAIMGGIVLGPREFQECTRTVEAIQINDLLHLPVLGFFQMLRIAPELNLSAMISPCVFSVGVIPRAKHAQ